MSGQKNLDKKTQVVDCLIQSLIVTDSRSGCNRFCHSNRFQFGFALTELHWEGVGGC